MDEILTNIQPWATAITAVFSIGVLGLLLRLMSQMKDIYGQRLEAAQDKASVTEERLKLSEEEVKRLEKINDGVTKIGASLGIEEFKTELASGVSMRDVGDNFSGKIAGGDINDIFNKIGKIVDSSQNSFKDYVDKLTKLMSPQSNDPRAYEYTIDMMFARGEKMRQELPDIINRFAEEGWSFYGLSSDYNGTDGMVLVFRRPNR